MVGWETKREVGKMAKNVYKSPKYTNLKELGEIPGNLTISLLKIIVLGWGGGNS